MSPSGSRSPGDLDARVDRLYALPLDEFVKARNALAAELKRENRPDEANRVKALARPSLPAWALNQVYWHARRDFDRLTSAGDRLRELQRQALAGRKVTLEEAANERQQAVRAVVERAAELMAEAGQTVTDATRQRIAASADAIAAYGSRPAEHTPGRLEKELEPPGFAALADLAASPGLRLVKSDRDTKRTAPPAGTSTRESREEAKARAAEARERERQRREALKQARGDRDALERAVEAARRAEAAAAAKIRELQREAEALQRQLSDAEEAVRRAEKDVEKARKQVEAAQEARRAAADRVRQLERAD